MFLLLIFLPSEYEEVHKLLIMYTDFISYILFY